MRRRDGHSGAPVGLSPDGKVLSLDLKVAGERLPFEWATLFMGMFGMTSGQRDLVAVSGRRLLWKQANGLSDELGTEDRRFVREALGLSETAYNKQVHLLCKPRGPAGMSVFRQSGDGLHLHWLLVPREGLDLKFDLIWNYQGA